MTRHALPLDMEAGGGRGRAWRHDGADADRPIAARSVGCRDLQKT